MSVNWYWKRKVGEIIYYSKEQKGRWKLEMFGGNMMCAFIYRFTKTNEETGKKEKWHTFFTFFDDIEHAKKCLKDMRLEDFPSGEHIVRKVRLRITSEYAYSNKEMIKLAEILAKMKYKVEVY